MLYRFSAVIRRKKEFEDTKGVIRIRIYRRRTESHGICKHTYAW